MRIAFVHSRFPAGGAERITVDIARYLKKVGGYEVFVYSSRLPQSLPEDIQEVLSVRKLPSSAFPSLKAKAVEKMIVEDGIDILVQVSKSLPGIDGIRSRTGCKAVTACHGEPFWQRHVITHRRQKGLFRKLLWLIVNRRRFADGTLAMSMAVERSRRDYDSSDAYTVLCESYRKETAEVFGLDPDESHIHAIENPEYTVSDPCLDKEKVIMFCGRLENWSKRIDRLLLIWKRVQDRLPDWRLVIVGDGPDGPMLRRMAGGLGLDRVSFEGHCTDVSGYYRKASVVALTSLTEGWPLALTEAQANGCICVAFGCTSGVVEILSPEAECGFIVADGDEELFAERLCTIASMPEEERIRIRKMSILKRAGYAPEIIAQKWRILFDTLIK